MLSDFFLFQNNTKEPQTKHRDYDERWIAIARRDRGAKIVQILLTLFTIGLLILPITILSLITGRLIVKIIVTLLFTLLFSSALSYLTKA